MARLNRLALVIVIAAVLIAAIVAIVRTARNRDRVQVQAAEVTSGPIARRVLVSGTLEPARMVEVGSQVSGTIASLPADFNARVKTGQVLARLDSASFHTRLAEAEAGLAKAEAERARRDRKSTRLNSSHLGISYAVFCLKKKK